RAGTATVGAMHDGDVPIRQGRALILGGDARVVPLRDLSQEDVREDVPAQAELLHALEVVGDHHGPDGRRNVVERRGGLLPFALRERGVTSAEVHGASDDLPNASA